MTHYCEMSNKAKGSKHVGIGYQGQLTLYLAISLGGLRGHVFHWTIRITLLRWHQHD